MQFKTTLFATMMLGAAAAHADYQVDVGASYSASTREWEYDIDYYDLDEDIDTQTLNAVVYFSPVSTANGPLAEAAFLSKASGVDVFYSKSEIDYDYDYDYDDVYGSGDYETDALSIGGHFVLPDSPLILEATLGQGEDDEVDFDYYAVGFGGYITDRIALLVEYSERELDIDGLDEDSIDRFQITYRQLIQLGGEQSLSIEPYLAHIDYYGEDSGEVGIAVAWYITRSLGLLAGVAGGAYDDDGVEYSAVASYVGIDYFVNENFRMGGKLLSDAGEYDSDFENGDREFSGAGLELDASVRF